MIIIAGCLSGGSVAGATSFMAKFVENEFHFTAGSAAIITGYSNLIISIYLTHLLSWSELKRNFPQ